jgi:cytochrome c oxidase cbb3-type subunit III
MKIHFDFRHLGLVLMLLLLAHVCFAQAKQDALNSSKSDATSPEGRTTFNSSCASCHGLDARGTDKGANIASASIQSLSDAQLASIIKEGVVEEGMPAFRNLSESQIDALVGYVRVLQGKGEATTLPGDAKRGQEIFFGKGDCGHCHTVAGQGGFLGPDLTNHAATSSADALRNEIIRSPRVPATGYRMGVLTTTAGSRMEGVIRNEDNFSVQLQTTDGNFHLLRKTDLKSLEHANSSLMPADYRDRLSDSDLNDLVSYLLTTPDKKNSASRQKKWDEDEE